MRPTLIKDIKKLESVQRRSTKFVIGHEYIRRAELQGPNALITSNLPLMYHSELADIMFLVTSLKHLTERFNGCLTSSEIQGAGVEARVRRALQR